MLTKAFFLILVMGSFATARGVVCSSDNLTVDVEEDGSYQITSKANGWSLGGNLPSSLQNLTEEQKQDAVGTYQQVSFSFTDADRSMTGSIRLYAKPELILFSQTLLQASSAPPSPFPCFTSFPQGLFHFSYRDNQFSPPQFDLEQISTPWLLFNQQDDALILSPASHFPIACMIGDGKTKLASGLNAKLHDLPAGFTQQSVLVLTHGINHALEIWGRALTDWEGKARRPNDADTVLKYLGYWTDNGGAYWYNFDLKKGYQGTLQGLMDSYREKQIPFRYLQLDSWWYHKTLTRYDGQVGSPMNMNLPEGDWNRYGGTVEYKAHPFVFPEGMNAFHEKVGLPFVTHNRWIDPTSPYHQRYKISGIAAVDLGFWNEIAGYLHDNGVICYEQDWLVEIFRNSPELSSTVDEGEAFLDTMAQGCENQGLSMQYCMATPRCFLQGSKYDNLTSIRVSDDHFIPDRYHDFFYTSKLADVLGIWPFADVFQSKDTNSALFSTLSAGPVGSGDAINAEDKTNLLKIVRSDGVIVKPDVPLVAMDRTYLSEAQHQNFPMLATTYTNQDGFKTVYLAAYKNSKTAADTVSVSSSELGCDGPFYFFDYFAGTGVEVESGASCSVDLHGRNYAYYVAAPLGGSGIALLGDADRFVGTGKKRISALHDDGHEVTAEVILAENEKAIKLRGYASRTPEVSVQGGTAGPVTYDTVTHLFTVDVQADLAAPAQTVDADAIRKITVALQ